MEDTSRKALPVPVQTMVSQEESTLNTLSPETLRRALPGKAGVYLFRDESRQVIYVGKAKNLLKRVLSYFKSPAELPRKTALMMSRARTLEYILTATENEAFILEGTLVRKWMPRYNIILRDDKRFLSLRLNLQERYPRLTLVRKIKKDGARYFGPYSSARSIRDTLKLIDRVFHLRKCKGTDLPKRSRPCLNYQLGRCLGACTKPVPEGVYKEVVDQAVLFLEGRSRELLRQFKSRMEKASEELRFEEAAKIRDQIQAVERVIQRQHVVSPKMEDEDVIGLAHRGDTFQLAVLLVRKGCLSDSREYRIENRGGACPEVMEAFLKQYYPRVPFIPKQILVSEPVEDMAAIETWISDLAGRKIHITRPRKGEKRRLTEMALSNAEDLLSRPAAPDGEDLMDLARSLLHLTNPPRKVEGIDISNIHGKSAVGAVVSFVDGFPHKAGYRSYRIKEVEGIDDYAMMAELVLRRLQKGDPPDLFLVDGGKGHLQTVQRVVKEGGLEGRTEVVSIAKEGEGGGGEKVYIHDRKNPVSFSRDHPLLLFLMRVRDEAHRRAVTHHRRLQRVGLTGSGLDGIPGMGPERKRMLLKHFGSVDAVTRAGLKELRAVPGIGPNLAEQILDYFSPQRGIMG